MAFLIECQVRPLIDLNDESKNEHGAAGHVTVLSRYSHFGKGANCQNKDLLPAYIDNLCRLGLLEIPAFDQYSNDGIYLTLINDPIVNDYIRKVEEKNNHKEQIVKKYVNITNHGQKFSEICIGRKVSFPI